MSLAIPVTLEMFLFIFCDYLLFCISYFLFLGDMSLQQNMM